MDGENNGKPKWMVKIMENPIKMDDLGVPLFLETSMCKGTTMLRGSNGPDLIVVGF